MPEMLIPHTSNRLIVFRHDPMTYSYRAAGERLVLQTWHMSGPFAPNPLGERIVSLPAEIQGERLHIISLMTRPPGNSFGPLALLDVYAGGTDTVTKVPVERFDIALFYMADEHEALGLGLSYTCHGAFCTENELYHFHNVFFKIGKDEARLMSLSQRVLLEMGLLWFHFASCAIPSVFYLEDMLFVWFCSCLVCRVRRVVPMFSSSKLSSHQKAHPNLFRSRFPS